MSNLGNYQRIIELSKKVGGPERFVAAVLAVGAIIGVSTDRAGTQAVKVGKAAINTRRTKKAQRAAKPVIRERNTSGATKGRLFAVTADGVDSSAGLSVRSGESFRVLESDGDAILIEVIGNANNPYMVSGHFLAKVSAFPTTDTVPGA